jgi:hypothetical protein
MRVVLLAASVLGITAGAELQITVYDRADLSDGARRSVFEIVGRIFRTSGIDVAWKMGALEAEEALLITYPARPPRGREREAACAARRDIALELIGAAPDGLKPTILAMSQPLATKGLNVRIFHDRVRHTAERESREYAVVLAHVIAHEIGHVLLRSIDHPSWGLMSAAWGKHEYGVMSGGTLRFEKNQARVMEEVLSGYGCSMAQSNQSPVTAK